MAAAAGTAKACYGAAVNRTTQGENKDALRCVKGHPWGTTRAAPEIAFGALPGVWRADPEAVETVMPLLELAKRVRHNTLDINHWEDAWRGEGRAGTPTGQVVLDDHSWNHRHCARVDPGRYGMDSGTIRGESNGGLAVGPLAET